MHNVTVTVTVPSLVLKQPLKCNKRNTILSSARLRQHNHNYDILFDIFIKQAMTDYRNLGAQEQKMMHGYGELYRYRTVVFDNDRILVMRHVRMAMLTNTKSSYAARPTYHDIVLCSVDDIYFVDVKKISEICSRFIPLDSDSLTVFLNGHQHFWNSSGSKEFVSQDCDIIIQSANVDPYKHRKTICTILGNFYKKRLDGLWKKRLRKGLVYGRLKKDIDRIRKMKDYFFRVAKNIKKIFLKERLEKICNRKMKKEENESRYHSSFMRITNNNTTKDKKTTKIMPTKTKKQPSVPIWWLAHTSY